VPYAEAQAIQGALVEERRCGAEHDTLLLLEHPPVITLGRGSDRNHLLVDELELARRGIELHHCGRGGDVTFHGPGQLVGYPILALRGERRDAHRYLRDLEQALIRAVGDLGVAAGREPGLTGIWAGGEKLAAIGVRLSTGWITSHGFALNVSTNLDGFSSIVPCGIRDRGVTSMARLLGRPVDMHDVGTRVAARLAEVFERRIVASSEAA
jgi:lipoate-protein ligase B